MASPLKLSKAYGTMNDAAIGGYKRILLNSVQWKTQEFAFWIILKAGQNQKANFHYTQPEGGDHDEVTLEVPHGVPVMAYCHTHPHTISTGNFSTGDKRSFVELRKYRPNVAFYLLNPDQEVRFATEECQFPAGTTVKWSNSVTP
jgi:hypothetical protein